ncbi:MAG: pyrophosphatase PpaX [Tuberibacillus sp.]
MITTLLFDLDGTLLNTNDLIKASFMHTLNHFYPNQYTEKDILPFFGEPLEVSFQRVDPHRVEELTHFYRKHNIEKHDEFVKEYPNVNTTLAALKEKGFKLAVVTTKRWETAKLGLKFANMESFFDTIVTIDDVEKPKPDPEPLLLALKKLEAKPEEAVMVGDSPSDVEAGHRAGTKTVAVSWAIKGVGAFDDVHPDFIIDDMSEMLGVVEQLNR